MRQVNILQLLSKKIKQMETTSRKIAWKTLSGKVSLKTFSPRECLRALDCGCWIEFPGGHPRVSPCDSHAANVLKAIKYEKIS